METWPELPYKAWKDTRDTLHLWTQIVGKVKLELCPFLLTARGLNTGTIPWRGESFDIDLDFINRRLTIRISDGQVKEMSLKLRTVADFYRLFMQTLTSLGIEVAISTMPAEMQNGIPFDQDTVHASYDKDFVQRWWRVMLAVGRVMEVFRTPFHGKSSPVQFYWGGFDLDTTRFNGKPAAPPSYGGRIMKFGENEENFAIGFWPGTDQFPHAAFYAYMSPAPNKVEEAHIQPEMAHFDTKLSEFVLLYDDVRGGSSPDETLHSFFQSTYEACALLANWDRAALEGNVPNLTKSR